MRVQFSVRSSRRMVSESSRPVTIEPLGCGIDFAQHRYATGKEWPCSVGMRVQFPVRSSRPMGSGSSRPVAIGLRECGMQQRGKKGSCCAGMRARVISAHSRPTANSRHGQLRWDRSDVASDNRGKRGLLRGHIFSIYSAQFSPDNKQIVTAGGDADVLMAPRECGRQRQGRRSRVPWA